MDDKNIEIKKSILNKKLLDVYHIYWDSCNQEAIQKIIDKINNYNGKVDDIDSFMEFLKGLGLDKSPEILAYYYHWLGYCSFDNKNLEESQITVEETKDRFLKINKNYPQNNIYFDDFAFGLCRAINSEPIIVDENIDVSMLPEGKYSIPVEVTEEEIIPVIENDEEDSYTR